MSLTRVNFVRCLLAFELRGVSRVLGGCRLARGFASEGAAGMGGAEVEGVRY